MDLKQIKQIIELMKRSDLSEFAFEEDGLKIKICRGANGLPVVSSTPTPVYAPAVTAPVAAPIAAPQAVSLAPAATDEAGVTYIKSPMVGTFYRAPNPESPDFVKVGDRVKVGQTLCIIEAMKLLNEIESEFDGVVQKILVENAHGVEFDQPLFVIA